VADWPARAFLLLQQPSGFGIEPQQEAWNSCHLGFKDQGRQLRLIGWGEELANQAELPFLQHRRTELVTMHQPPAYAGWC
jgi:hypothetical protein